MPVGFGYFLLIPSLQKGCGDGSFYGVSSVPEGLSAPGTFRTFTEVVTAYLDPAVCPAADCSPSLVNFPAPTAYDAYGGTLTLASEQVPVWLVVNRAFLQSRLDELWRDYACQGCAAAPAPLPASPPPLGCEERLLAEGAFAGTGEADIKGGINELSYDYVAGTNLLERARGMVASDRSGNHVRQTEAGPFVLKTHYLYGSARLGEVVRELPPRAGVTPPDAFGRRHYEMTNHLGNVATVIGEHVVDYTDITGRTYQVPEVLEQRDYLPFGLGLVRQEAGSHAARGGVGLQLDAYRFAFNGMELDNEGEWGSGTTSYDYEFSGNDLNLWLSETFNGAVMQFHASHLPTQNEAVADWASDDLTVVVTDFEVTDNYACWVFATTTSNGGHAVSGSRQFGLARNSNGNYTLWTRGTDRANNLALCFNGSTYVWGGAICGLICLMRSTRTSTIMEDNHR